MDAWKFVIEFAFPNEGNCHWLQVRYRREGSCSLTVCYYSPRRNGGTSGAVPPLFTLGSALHILDCTYLFLFH